MIDGWSLRRWQKELMECEKNEQLYADRSFLRCCTGSDGYSANWTHYEIVSQ